MKHRLVSAVAICSVCLLAGCGTQTTTVSDDTKGIITVSNEIKTSKESPASSESPSSTESSVSTETTVSTESNVSNETITDIYYSSDNSVSLKINYENDADDNTAFIVDGDTEIPVDLIIGRYAFAIEKKDIDGDGEGEYLIAENEGGGSSCNMNGLVIVDVEGGETNLTRYDSAYFSEILSNRITTKYDNKEFNEIDIYIDGERDQYVRSVYPLPVNEEDGEFASFCWTDIVYIQLIDGEVWLSAPAGFTHTNNRIPHYEEVFNVTAPITVNPDKTIEVGAIRPYTSSSLIDYELLPIEKESEVYSCFFDVTHDGIGDLIRVTYITADDFDGNLTENTFHNGAFGYVKVYSDLEGSDYFDEQLDKVVLPFWGTEYAYAHTGNRQVFVTTVDSKAYLVTTSLYDGQGSSYYSYEVFFLGPDMIYHKDGARLEFETETPPDTTAFFEGLNKWINEDSVLLMAADIELDPSMYYSTKGNVLNPEVYYSQRR
ncbi:MAG: hypothetical protein K6E19_11030 [Lachnospiraceae bacterium]|nr:hypothetical protein [Lachnospiraceae bacterium]